MIYIGKDLVITVLDIDLVASSKNNEIAEALRLLLSEQNTEVLIFSGRNENYRISLHDKSIKLTNWFEGGNYTMMTLSFTEEKTEFKLPRASKLLVALMRNKSAYSAFINNLIHIRNTNSDLILNQL